MRRINCKVQKIFCFAACCLGAFAACGKAQEVKPSDYVPSATDSFWLIHRLKDIDRVNNALSQGASPNARLPKGARSNGRIVYDNTILIDVAKQGFIDSATVLLDHGADVNAKNLRGYTALMASVGGESPLWGTRSSVGSPEVVELLLQRGANVNAKSDEGVTALMMAAGTTSYQESGKQIVEIPDKNNIVRLLLEKGADVNARSKSGTTALFQSVRTHSAEVTRLLIQNGADNKSMNEALLEVIRLAYIHSFSDSISMIRVLLIDGANPNADNGESLKLVTKVLTLDGKSINGDRIRQMLEILHLLVDKNVDFKNHNGAVLLRWAQKNHQRELVNLLKQHGVKLH